MRRIIFGCAVALLTFAAGADVTIVPPGPFAGSTLDPATYLDGKILLYGESRSLPYATQRRVAFENVIARDRVSNSYERLLILMEKGTKGQDLEPIALVKLATVEVPVVAAGAIVINGFDDDWVGIAPAVTDLADDYGPLAGEAGTDLASVTLARDDDYLYGRVGTHDGGPRDNTMYIVELQQYFLQMHSPGDLLVNCSKPTSNGWECGVGDRTGAGRAYYPPDSGAVQGGSGFIEWKIPISDLENRPSHPHAMFPAGGKQDRGIENRFIRSYIHPLGSEVTDELPPFGRPLIIDFFD